MASDEEGRESRRSGGGKYCVAGVSCTNGQYTDGVSIHHFPDQNKDKDLYLKWVQFVRKHRPSFKGQGPRSQVVLCSAHFKDECFNIRNDIAEQIGIRRALVKGTYPSIDVAGVVQLDPEPFTDGKHALKLAGWCWCRPTLTSLKLLQVILLQVLYLAKEPRILWWCVFLAELA